MKKIIVLGGIGTNERKNRDGFRVLSGGGMSVGLQAHIHIEPPLVVKRFLEDGEENNYPWKNWKHRISK